MRPHHRQSSSSFGFRFASVGQELCGWARARSHFIIVRSLWRFVLRVFYKLLGSNACNDNNDFDTPTLNSQRYVLPWISCVISWQVDRTCNCFHSEWLISFVVVVVVVVAVDRCLAFRFVSFFFVSDSFPPLLVVVIVFFFSLAFCYICLVCAMCAAMTPMANGHGHTAESNKRNWKRHNTVNVIVFFFIPCAALRLSVVRWELKYIIFMCENIFVAWHSINAICIAFAQRHNDDHDGPMWMDADGQFFAVQFHARHSTELYALRPCWCHDNLKAPIKTNKRMTLQFRLVDEAAHAITSTFRCDVFCSGNFFLVVVEVTRIPGSM